MNSEVTTMAEPATLSRETTLNLRLDAVLKADFMAAAEFEGQSAAEVLRDLMRAFVDDVRRRHFAAEARRQSQLVSSSSDEAEIMRWIADVSDTEGSR
jgi:hypothetical protein